MIVSRSGTRRRQHRWAGAGAVALVVAGLAVGCSTKAAEATPVRLEPAAIAGADPFTESTEVTKVTDFDTDVRAVGGQVVEQVAETGTGGSEGGDRSSGDLVLVGTTPGLYGGSGSKAVCDPEALVSFLEASPRKAAAWAAVFDVPVDGIAGFVAGLTPTVLTVDTRVTNHGFRGGKATPFQAVLEAGTAVLVDARGVPRVKCNCGNPLTPPKEVGAVDFTGQRWEAFSEADVATVEAGKPIETFTLVDLDTGKPIEVPAGSGSGAAGWVAAVADDDGGSSILTSDDGATWTRVGRLDGQAEGLVQTADGWLAAGPVPGEGGTGATPDSAVWRSTDLRTWTRIGDIEGSVEDLAFDGTTFVAVGSVIGSVVAESGVAYATPVVATSTDGATWAVQEDGMNSFSYGNREEPQAVEHVDGLGFVVADRLTDDAGSEGSLVTLHTSTDGRSWTSVGSDGDVLAIELGPDPDGSDPVVLADDGDALLMAATRWTEPPGADGLGDAPRMYSSLTRFAPPSKITSVACGLCNPDGEDIEATPFDATPAAEMAGGDGFLAAADDEAGTIYASADGGSWSEVGALDGRVLALAHGAAGAVTAEEPPAVTTTAPVSSTTTAPSPTTRPAGAVADVPTYSESAASGAGCSPDGYTLGDGWWYGLARSEVRAGAWFDFDLACFYYGRIAAQTAHAEDPTNYPSATEIDDDVYVSNENELTRSVLVADDADLRCIDLGAGRTSFDTEAPCASPGAATPDMGGGSWAIWIRIEGGRVTKVLEQFHP